MEGVLQLILGIWLRNRKSFTTDFKEAMEAIWTNFSQFDDVEIEDSFHPYISEEIMTISTENDQEFSSDEVRRVINKFAS